MVDREFDDTTQCENNADPIPINDEDAQSSVYEVNELDKVQDNGEYSIDKCSVITTYEENGFRKRIEPYQLYRTHFKGKF